MQCRHSTRHLRRRRRPPRLPRSECPQGGGGNAWLSRGPLAPQPGAHAAHLLALPVPSQVPATGAASDAALAARPSAYAARAAPTARATFAPVGGGEQ